MSSARHSWETTGGPQDSLDRYTAARRAAEPPTETKNYLTLKDSVTRFFASGFFHESVSPQPQSIPSRPFRFFSKFAEIFTIQGAQPVSTTPAAVEKFATGVVDTGDIFRSRKSR
jgi:hypothetical protein